MSSVDRAFIRAYSKQTAPSAAAAEATVNAASTSPVAAASTPYDHPSLRTVAPRPARVETPGAMWGAGRMIHQPHQPQPVAGPYLHMPQAHSAEFADPAQHAQGPLPQAGPALPQGAVPEPAAARVYSAWTTLARPALLAPPPAVAHPTSESHQASEEPRLSGEEQLKREIERLRAVMERAIEPLPAPRMDLSLSDSVQSIDAFAKLENLSEFTVGNYVCVSDDFDPGRAGSAMPGVTIDLMPLPTSLVLPFRNVATAPAAMETPVAAAEVVSQVIADQQAEPKVDVIAPPVVEASPQPVAEKASEVPAAPAQPEEPASTANPHVEIEVLWEVDQFLYPPVTDKLLSGYAYFAQAGEKIARATRAGLKVMAITGVARQEGRTTLAICLARAASRAGLKVGLLDADFHSPALATQLGLEVERGWEAVLAGEMALPEVAVRAVEEHITLYPWIAREQTSRPAIFQSRVMEVIQQATRGNQLLILDLGPWSEMNAGSPTRLPFDAALVVRDVRSRDMQEITPIARWLSDAGVEAVGIAENFTQ